MEKEKRDMTKRLFSLTLEIIYLLTGEDYKVVKESGELITRRISHAGPCKSNGADISSAMLSTLSLPREMKKRKILKLSGKVIHMLTGEVQKLISYAGSSYGDVTESPQPTSPRNGSSYGDPQERYTCPLYSPDSAQGQHSVSEDEQEEHLMRIKVEVLDEEDVKDELIDKICKEEAFSPEGSSDGSGSGNLPARGTGSLYSHDSSMEDHDSPQDDQVAAEVRDTARMDDQQPFLAGRPEIKVERNPTPIYPLPRCHPRSFKQETGLPPQSAVQDYESYSNYNEYYNTEERDFKEEEEEEPGEEDDEIMDEHTAPEDDQLEHLAHGMDDVATQTDQSDNMQIKEEEDPVDINASYDRDSDDASPEPSATTSRESMLDDAIDEYGQSASKPKQFICSECGKGFHLYSYLTKHQRCHSDEKPFTCLECGKCFRYKPSLVAHQRVHTGEKPFSCMECGKLFVTKFNLKAHEKVHTGEKPVECPACGRCFANNPALVKHLRIHTGEKPFSCAVCCKVFASRSCLTAHQVIHTGERPYMCAECGKAFANQSNLISHRIIHTGQKPYTCPECGRGFANQSNLAKHKLTHTDHKPFVCIECGNLFARKEGLSKHFERIHKKKLEF
ncbi:uncharacterized protein [Hyperolius riggenbachi]|uniref:uncharacterized protein isoform X1 n=1 Tax=Hyperolius riggenbachi TaxID=752182 RepID=UPI0035A26606